MTLQHFLMLSGALGCLILGIAIGYQYAWYKIGQLAKRQMDLNQQNAQQQCR